MTSSNPQTSIAATGEAAAGGSNDRLDGMRREWNFRITISHQAAKAVLQLVPQWQSGFTAPDVLERISKEHAQSQATIPSATSSSRNRQAVMAGGEGLNISTADLDSQPSPFYQWYTYNDMTPAVTGGEVWEEVKKEISFFYNTIPEPMTVESFCQLAVREVLTTYPSIVSIDGDVNLHRLKMGKKVTGCTERLGGQPSFAFHFATHGTASRKAEFGIVMGTTVGHRGYLVILRCEKEQELDNYFRTIFLRHFKDAQKFALNQAVTYTTECSNEIMRDAQRLFGELRYYDTDAAVSFAFPMHPMKIRPDFSPTQTVDVGSIACMTFEVDTYQRMDIDLLEGDDSILPTYGGKGGAGEAPPTSMDSVDFSRYKAANAVLFVDVELVAKQGYPRAMSINQFLQLKLKRLLETFKDARLVGEAQAGQVGPRPARSQHVTFTYEGNPDQAGVVKALMTTTLVGNFGITALYFTRLQQGLFDHHLYLYQHLARSFQFYGEGDLRGKFSRFDTRNIRLAEQDIARAYPTSSTPNEVQERHLRALQASNDGKCEGAIVYVVDPRSMVGVRKDSLAAHEGSAAGDTAAPASTDSIPKAVRPRGLSEELAEAFDDATEISVDTVPRLAGGGGAAKSEQPPTPTAAVSTTPSHEQRPSTAEGAGRREREAREVKEDLPLNDRPASPPPAVDDLRPRSAGTPQPKEPSPTAAVDEAQPSGEGAEEDPYTRPPPPPKSSALVEEALAADDNLYFGPSLRDVYCRCCEHVSCRPNSYLFNKLPRSSRFTEAIEELDLSSNYLGHQGFQAILNFLEYLPKIQTLIFNDMSLDNEDISHLCECMEKNTTVHTIYLRANPKVSLPATKHITRMIRANKRIHTLGLGGTSLGEGLINRIEGDASANKRN